MEQVSINPVFLKRFTKHLCILAKKHHDRESAHQDLEEQLEKLKRISGSLSKSALKNEIKDLEKKINLVIRKEADLYQVGKIERLLMQKLKDKIYELEQFRKIELSKKDAELSQIQKSMDKLQKKQEYLINLKNKAQFDDIAQSASKENIIPLDKDELRKRIFELELRYNAIKENYDPEQLSVIKDRISSLKERI
jgi:hypothetical protein